MARSRFVVPLASPVPSSRKRSPFLVLLRQAKTLKTVLLPLLLLASTLAFGQSPTQGTLPNAPMYKDVSLFDLGVNLSVPIVSKPGIGTSFNVSVQYNSNFYVVAGQPGAWFWSPSNYSNMGWNANGLQVAGYSFDYEDDTCPYPPLSQNPIYPRVYTGYTDPRGVYHPFNPAVYILQGGPPNLCHGHRQVDHTTFTTQDNTGLTINLSWGNAPTVVTSNGTTLAPYTSTATDLYNNVTSLGVNGWTDTVGVNELTVTYNGLITTYKYPTTSGPNTASVTETFVTHNIATNFGCPNTGEYNGHANLLDHITFADGSTESFTYESQVAGTLTGRVASVTYPDGSVVSYTYGSTNCGGIPLSLTRTDAMGATTITWNSGTSTTVISPTPASNKSVYTFVGTIPTENVSQIQEYQGSSGNPIRTTTICYNGNQTNCSTTNPNTLHISQRDVYTLYAGMSGSSRSTTKFDIYGNVTETDAYDFGASTQAFKTVYSSYGSSWNGSSCVAIGNGVNDVPCTVEKYDINGNPIGYSTFTYNSKGSLLSRSTWVSGALTGGQYLTSSYSYNNNGTVYQATGANNVEVTTNTYGDCNSGGLTESVSPISIVYTQFTHDSGCYGFATLSVTPPDGNTSYATFSDPLWRLTSTTDAAGIVTTFSYTVPNNTSESILSSGGITKDSYVQHNVTANPPTVYAQSLDGSNWDTVISSSYWDTYGITSTSNLPCSANTKGGSCTGATSTVTHDALGRPLVTADGGSGTITNTYILSGNRIDTLTVRGPAPAGEVVKQVQKEYNGLGQLLSSCWISSTSGTASCGQVGGGTGFLQTYSYNTDGTLASVTRGSQTHSFTYDRAGRMLTSVYPESGTKQYFYDSAPSTPGVACSTVSLPTNATPLGHLLKTYDANGTTTCFSYDALGRTIGIAYSGTKFDGNNKYFVYDAATVNSVAMVNTLGRLAEQYTAPTISGTKVTDEGFSYSARGELSDVYQWSTHSGGWYHTSATYFANGVVNTLTGVPGNTPWTYGVDSAGRVNTAKINTTNQATAATYNAAGQPLTITLGLGDTDTYSYDSNTGRMTSYDFAIGPTSKHFTGTPSWNANGTLRGLTVVDGVNAGADSEVCDFGNTSNAGYDEFKRLIRVNCWNGSTAVWGQNFTYDQYNNLQKTVPSGQTGTTWSTTYSSTNNTYTAATYDSNGNLLTDTFHTYTWNQDNHPHTIDAITLTYDAAGRMVEKYDGTHYYQELISPIGEVALMKGQTVNDYRMPLPGGSTAAGTSGNKVFEHRDWLGNIPFVSTWSARASKYARLFAPYSESYNQVGGSGALIFTGDHQDIIAGLYDTPNRELNPSGRWISPDPAHSAWNAYQYSTNPMSTVDPSGLVIMNFDATCRYRDCSTNLDGVAHVAAGSEQYTGAGCISLDGGGACAQLVGSRFDWMNVPWYGWIYGSHRPPLAPGNAGPQSVPGELPPGYSGGTMSFTIEDLGWYWGVTGYGVWSNWSINCLFCGYQGEHIWEHEPQPPSAPKLTYQQAEAFCYLAAQIGTNAFQTPDIQVGSDPGASVAQVTQVYSPQGENIRTNPDQVNPTSSAPPNSVNPTSTVPAAGAQGGGAGFAIVAAKIGAERYCMSLYGK